MYWANLLHIYQPPTQKAHWIERIARESYSKIFSGLKNIPQAKLTLNINAILTELLIKHGWNSIIDDIRELAERGQIEFSASAKYHPFLPLLPEREIIRQIELNNKTNKKIFGKVYAPVGFFPTEMGLNNKVVKIAAKMGYEWIIAAELAYPKATSPDITTIYHHDTYKDLLVYFRNKDISFKLLSAEVGVAAETAAQLTRVFGELFKKEGYFITAIDGETFGHHRPGLEELLFDLYKSDALDPVTIGELKNLFSKRAPISPRDSTWALLKKDLENKTPFSRWFNKKNEIQVKQWELTNLVLLLIKKYPQKKPRILLDRALHSDQYWWSSAQPWWSIEMIEAGAKDFINTVEAFKNIPIKYKRRAQKLYQEILFTAFEWQRGDKIAKLAKESDEDITQRISKEKPYIPLKEFNSIVDNLDRQMLIAAGAKEYERASQLRDRIKELNENKATLTKKKK